MIFHLNYPFLSNRQFIFNKISLNKNPIHECKTLESPKTEGPADHVAFVIHGIGQQTEEFGFFQKHLNSLYDTTSDVVKKNQAKSVNVQYIPIEWHKHIHEETDQMMNDITLNSIPRMRMINNDYLSDAFFYLSKERGQSIINHVTQSFNQAYENFMQDNPNFKGKIAILAYSLGGIITWDILSNQIYSKTTKKEIQTHSKLPDLDFPTLKFKPDFLFNLGSPLSAFLTVRNQDPKYYRPDPSIIFENIFHPFDPLAYRFEPMLNIGYKQVPAVLIDPHLELPSRLEAIKEYFVSPNLKRSRSGQDDPTVQKRRKSQEQEITHTTVTRTALAVVEVPPSSVRVDFVLRPETSLFGFSKNPYLSGLTAHFSYWHHKDLLWHIVRRLENWTF